MSKTNKTDLNSPKADGKAILFFGAAPYALLLILSIFSAINGYAIPFFGNSTKSYGFDAGLTVFVFSLFLYWPVFLIGAIMILAGIIILIKQHKK